MSDHFLRGQQLLRHTQEYTESVKLGAESGCVPSMCVYATRLAASNKIHMAVPWALEGAIRGSVHCTSFLVEMCYQRSKPIGSYALSYYWMKIMNVWDRSVCTIEQVEHMRDDKGKRCSNCRTPDSATVELRKCGMCQFYYFCSEECQIENWKEPNNHMNECRQLRILNKYHRPYANEIREAALNNSSIPALQKLRNKLGLTRPREEYYDLIRLDRPHIYRYKKIAARKDGTVYVGSTTKTI